MINLDHILPALISCSIVLLISGGVIAYRRRKYPVVLVLIVILGLVLRVFASTDAFLHLWDESFHAVVAKNCMTTPFVPVLYKAPALPYDYRNWLANHVWLHKPPLALWLMAGSLKVLGINEFAVRFPSMVMSSLLIIITYGIGTLLWERRHGLLAAALCAVNYHLVELAAGREATDHVDTLLVTLVAAGAYVALRVPTSRNHVLGDVTVGAIAGLAYLTKGLPGLFVVMFWVAIAIIRGGFRRDHVWRCLLVVIVTGFVAAPWTIYTRHAYPQESSWESFYTIRHVFETLEGHPHPWYYYLDRMGTWLGPASYLALLWAILRYARQHSQRELLLLLMWFAVPHVIFSLVATKMPAYTTITASAGFLLIAFFVVDVWDRAGSQWNRRWPRCIVFALLLVLICLPLPRTLKRLHLIGAYERKPRWAQQLRALAADCTNPEAVVFAVPHHIEAMFYGNFTAYNFLPSRNDIINTVASGREVVIYDQGNLPAWIGEMVGVRVYCPPPVANAEPTR